MVLGGIILCGGGVNGIYQVVGRATYNIRARLRQKMGINGCNNFFTLLKCLITFMLIDFTWIFFRADNISNAIGYLKRMLVAWNFKLLFDDSFYNMGLAKWEFILAVLLIIALFFIEYLQYYKSLNSKFFDKEQLLWRYRWIFYCIYIFIMVIEICGKFGVDANQFIYFQF